MTKARTLADNYAADISGITAGTGITGGGTSGTVTITNDMATTIAAKGDLVVGTGNDTYAALTVASTAGYLLTVDSGETTGLKWAAPAAAGFVGCKAYVSANKTIATATSTALDYEAESFDTDSFHDNSTNPSRFTIPSGKGGKYRIDAQVWFNQVGGPEAGLRSAALFKNGTQISTGFLGNTTTDESTAFTISHIEDCAVSDYLQLFVYHTQGSNVVCSAGEISNSFTLTYLGA